ncbi:MAG TPA: winged helix-turn-helix transcriptional regulator [Methanocella sp.]|nr:winged helix-turn-helix transcriptional regulator [Methanocella sp.]
MDDTDFRLLKALVMNSRTTYRELADGEGLSVNAVHKRVQAMIDRGIVRQFTISLTGKALPQQWIKIGGASDAAIVGEAVERLGRSPLTARVIVAGGNYMYVRGVLHDVSELGEYVNFVIREGRLKTPVYGLLNHPPPRGSSDVSLTRTDFRILATLQDDARKPIAEVSRELCVTAKTIGRRVERMENNGLLYYLTRYDPAPAGDVFALLNLYAREGLDNRKVAAMLKVKYARHMLHFWTYSTRPDLIVFVARARTMAELKVLQDTMQAEGLFDRIVPNIAYHMYYFDTWCQDHVREKASVAPGVPEHEPPG